MAISAGKAPRMVLRLVDVDVDVDVDGGTHVRCTSTEFANKVMGAGGGALRRGLSITHIAGISWLIWRRFSVADGLFCVVS